jgi:DNA polymerase-1
VLAFPTRSELGKRIRQCVVAPEGYVILSADYSQIELRTMADHCGDRRMQEAFENEEDLHAITASIIFKKGLKKISKEERYVAKTLNFAIMYGISAWALLEQFYKAGVFRYTLEDCRRFIDEWFKIYGSVMRFLREVWKEAEKNGFVRDMWGRICYVPNLRLSDQKLREAAERLTGNFKIQSGASGVTKRGEIRLLDEIDKRGLRMVVRPFLQLHDELDLEVKKDLVEEMLKLVPEVMCRDQDRFKVPIKVEAKTGSNWAEAK